MSFLWSGRCVPRSVMSVLYLWKEMIRNEFLYLEGIYALGRQCVFFIWKENIPLSKLLSLIALLDLDHAVPGKWSQSLSSLLIREQTFLTQIPDWVHLFLEKKDFTFLIDDTYSFHIQNTGPDMEPKLWIEKTNDLVDIETEISRNLKGLVAIEIATAVRKKSLAGFETAIWFFETQPRRERELDC